MASNAQVAKLVAEAEQCIKNAEKFIKTSLTKWSSDYDSAAYEYQRAALNYRNVKQLEKAKDIYMKAADCYLKTNSPFHAAKQYEQAGFCLRDAGKLQEGADLVCKAAACFQQAGDLDTATIVLAKAAKFIEETNSDQAVQIYKRAADLAEIEDKYTMAADHMGKAASLEIRSRKLIDTRGTYEKQLEYSVKAGGTGGAASTPSRVVLSMIVVNVAMGDLVAARRAMDLGLGVPNFTSSEECHVGSCLVDALERGDSKTTVTVLRNPIFKFMDNEIAKLAAEMLSTRKEQADAEDAAAATASSQGRGGGEIGADEEESAAAPAESQDLSFLQ